MDTWPRNRFTEADRRRLEHDAMIATEMLELHLLRTDQRAADERVERRAETCPDAMIIADEKGVIRFWNAGSHRLFGYAPADALGMTVMNLLPAHRRYEPGDFEAMLGRYVGRTREDRGSLT